MICTRIFIPVKVFDSIEQQSGESTGHDESRHKISLYQQQRVNYLRGYSESIAQRRRWTAMEEPQWDQLIPNVNTQDRQCGSSSKSNRIQTSQFAVIIEPCDRDFQYRHLAFTSYRQQQSGLHEVCWWLTFGSKTYGCHPSPEHVNANSAWKKCRVVSSWPSLRGGTKTLHYRFRQRQFWTYTEQAALPQPRISINISAS